LYAYFVAFFYVRIYLDRSGQIPGLGYGAPSAIARAFVWRSLELLFMSGLELKRQLGAHSKITLPPRQLPSGLVTTNRGQFMESARPADATGAFRI
jgi:hypothetical protein